MFKVSFPGAAARTVFTRRKLFQMAICGAAGAALYAGEIDRHWLETTRHEVRLPGLAPEFNGFRIVQISDIHMDEFTEPFFVREVVRRINQLQPDAIFMTGDFVSHNLSSRKFMEGAAWQCANILAKLECRRRYAIFGNHDVRVSKNAVGAALRDNGMAVLDNSCLPLECGGQRIWIAGLDDPGAGRPDPEQAIPISIRNQANEPVILLCHAPDYADFLKIQSSGQAVSWMLSGHTHGGQVRMPFLPPFHLPPWGKNYVAGWFRVGHMQLYVNRGLGTTGIPFRLYCAPEITAFTLRA